MPDFPAQRIYDERARALAAVFLTRRDDLAIAEGATDAGPDLLVRIDRGDRPMRLEFAVFLKAVAAPLTAEQAQAMLRSMVDRSRATGQLTFPACSFLFSMREDFGYFAWLTEPIIQGDVPKLIPRPLPDCVPLNDAVLDEVVDRVVAWYDAFAATVMA